ncbi:hypothetical protein PVAND_011510 [Polypedilum vanderplanki]|uniref:Uncharacterized protein n=1 Tax=Polypedilum vanderplanki TaxID=319348 RepID=A0A9J6CJP1_POLVA|nr:hypothetical protein PVAND_011510 [Polypedilum vanderplanki]
MRINSAEKQLNEKPYWLKHCNVIQPNEGNCFKEMLVGILPLVKKGVPELDIKPFEPLNLGAFEVNRSEDQFITLNGNLSEIKVYGASNASVLAAHLDINKKIMQFSLEIPKLRLNSSYNLKGGILLLPVVGSGNVNILLKNIKTTILGKISIKKLPEEAIHIDEMKVRFSVEKMRMHFGNLFNGNRELSASFHMFLNQNSNEILNILKEALQHELAHIFIKIWNSVFNKFPIKFWLN